MKQTIHNRENEENQEYEPEDVTLDDEEEEEREVDQPERDSETAHFFKRDVETETGKHWAMY